MEIEVQYVDGEKDNQFHIENDILYYGTEELCRDCSDDILYMVDRIINFAHDTVWRVWVDGEKVYENEEDPVSDSDYDDEDFPKISDYNFEETYNKYMNTIKEALGE